ncbi:MAG: methyl-accepting chemotaxis protein [Defluviitaleaceae bacterium]|nr:methyl-accepting chemotaxis protein [Defluviitaleaceae bacterium]
MNWFRNLKIRAKILIGSLLIAGLLIAVTVFALFQMNILREQYQNVLSGPVMAENYSIRTLSEARGLRRMSNSMVRFAPQANNAADINIIRDETIETIDNFNYYFANMQNSLIGLSNSSIDSYVAEIASIFQVYTAAILGDILNYSLAGNWEAAHAATTIQAPNIERILELLGFVGEHTYYVFIQENINANAIANQAFIASIILVVIFSIISILLASFIATEIARPVVRLSAIASDIVAGRLNINTTTKVNDDEIGHLTSGMFNLTSTIKTIVDGINTTIEEIAIKGNIDYRLDESGFEGSYKDLIASLNSYTETFVNDTLFVINISNSISEGNFGVDVPVLPGKKIILTNTLNSLLDNLKEISREISFLASAASSGDLGQQASADKYKGDWNIMLNQLNLLIANLVNPVNEIKVSLYELSNGNFVKMKGSYQGEFEELKTMVNQTIDNMSTYIVEISEILGRMADKNLSQKITREYVGEFDKIKISIVKILDSLNNVIGEIGSASDQVNIGAKQISAGAMNLATGASQQASSLEEINATIDVVTELASLNLKNVKNVDEFATGSQERAKKSNEDMGDLLKAMEGIKEFSFKISNIIKVIDDIAFQTNLLALNASVEAARAGEHGRGFAVVAEEVRALASRSQNAARETKDLIEESIRSVEEGTGMADKTAESLNQIVQDSIRIASLIEEIATSTTEQNESFNQIAAGIGQITSVVTSNSATSEEAASSSEELSSQSDVMKDLVGQFIIKS